MSNDPTPSVNSGRPDDVARRTLQTLIQKYGKGLCDDPRRCEGLLRDLCPSHRREIHVLMAAINERVAAELISSDGPLPFEMVLNRLVKRLVDNRGLTTNAAQWSVESWALALGIISEDDVTSLPPSSDSVTEDNRQLNQDVATVSAPGPVAVAPSELRDQRRAKGLSAKGLRLLEALDSLEDIPQRLGAAEDALAAFTDSLQIIPTDPTSRQGLDAALEKVATLSAECGSVALRKRDYSLARRSFQRTLEIDPGHAEAESRVAAIAKTRLEFLTLARENLEKGQSKVAVRVLDKAVTVFPDDLELKSLLKNATDQLSVIRTSVEEQIPLLERDKRLCELLSLIESLEDDGIPIQGLENYKASLKQRIEAVATKVQEAASHLAAGDISKALAVCDDVLKTVADHEGALTIKETVNHDAADAQGASKLIQETINNGRWFKAKQLSLSRHTTSRSATQDEQLFAELDQRVSESTHFWKALLLALTGLAVWILAGKLAFVFSDGLRQALIGDNFIATLAETITAPVAGQAAQLFFAFLFLTFLGAIFSGKNAFRSIGPSIGFMIIHAVLCGFTIVLKKETPQEGTVIFLVFYGLICGLVLAEVIKRMLNDERSAPFFMTALVASITAPVFAFITLVPENLHPELLGSRVLYSIVLCSLLPIFGIVRRPSRLALVPLAVILSFGIELGAIYADASTWTPYFPWINCILVAGAIVLLIASEGRRFQIAGVFLVAVLTTVAFLVLPGFVAYPSADVLVAVWFSALGTLCIVHRDRMLPNLQIVDAFHLWRARRPAKSTLPSTKNK